MSRIVVMILEDININDIDKMKMTRWIMSHTSTICRREVSRRSSMKMVQSYISTGARQILSSTQKSDEDLRSSIMDCSCHVLWWNLISVETDKPFQRLNFHDGRWKIMIPGCGAHYSLDFAIELTAGNRLKLLFVIPILCQSVDTWRRDVHHYCL